MKLIVGLGNPGSEYAQTRHNIGFMIIDRLAADLGVKVGKTLFKALTGQANIAGEKIILAKPQTYMNLSGGAVAALMNWFKLAPTDLLVIYDDMDLPTGRLRLRQNGSAGGHNGMKNIIQMMGTQEFSRMRAGIGRPEIDTVGFVLGKFKPEERETMEQIIATAVEAVKVFVTEGTTTAMNKFNHNR